MGTRFARPRVGAARPAQLVGGLRAGPGAPAAVGYLGAVSDLPVINQGDPTPAEWAATWDVGTLEVRAPNAIVDHHKINASVVFLNVNPIMSNCVITPTITTIGGVSHNGSSLGTLTCMDTTIQCVPGVPASQDGLSSDAALRAIRCDISGSGDGIHAVARENGGTFISQCYIHDLAFLSEEQHLDGIQIFQFETGGPTSLTIEHCTIEATESPLGTPMNSAIIMGTGARPALTPTVNNCSLGRGLGNLEILHSITNATVTNNDFPEHGFFFDVSWEDGTILEWSNNRDAEGDLIPPPI